ncbi:uncharacterized protein LOC143684631 [Tamandua tetradactyla]|uniref:uncharacterized protein LOC143684631 n=1 Tax=Tamandua tetradactyla TaxID=48850 RepID=UPI004054239E
MWSLIRERRVAKDTKQGNPQEEKWVNSSKAESEILPTEDFSGEEKEEEEIGNKTLLRVPRQESASGLVAWPRSSRQQALWWEDDMYFSLPPSLGLASVGAA